MTNVFVYFSDEFKGHSILEGCRQADLARVKKYLEVVNFKHPYTGETALVCFHKKAILSICFHRNLQVFLSPMFFSKSIPIASIISKINLVSY